MTDSVRLPRFPRSGRRWGRGAILPAETPPQGDGRHEHVKADKKQILNRLATIEGHLRGIRKMVDADQYCVDILKQTYAVERALKAFESALLEGHLSSCVPSGFKEGRDDEMIRELGELFELSRK